MPGSVDDVDTVVFPVGGGSRGGDSDTPFFFLGHPVHGSIAIVHSTGTVNAPGGEEDLFRYSSFTCIYMGYKADITNAFNGKRRFH